MELAAREERVDMKRREAELRNLTANLDELKDVVRKYTKSTFLI